MKKFFYILALGLSVSLASCAPSEVDDLFDENPAVRIDNAVKNYTELLKSNGGRWLLKYFPNGDQEGYNFVMHFKNGSVEISSKNSYFDFAADESLWDVISDFGPVLTFNTYNEVFHPFSDPEPDGTGLGGDYEFIIMSADENTINLRGKKTGIAAELVRISDATSDLDIFNQIDAQRAISFSSLVDTLYLTTSTGYQFGAIGHNGMVWTFFPDEGNHASNLIDYPEHMNSMFTLNGLRFMGPLDFISEYDPEAFIPQNFTLQEDGTLLAEDGVTRISAGALSKVFCSQRVSFNIDKDNMGGDFKTLYDNFLSGAKAKLRRTISSMAFTYFNFYESKPFNHFGLHFKAANLNCFIFLDYTVIDGNTLSMSFNPNATLPYNDNGRTYYGGDWIDSNGAQQHTDGVQEVRDFISMLSSRQFSFKADNMLCPTKLTIYDKANPENYFVLKMVNNPNYIDESTIEY